jgi:hypothetical protein
MPSVGFEPKIQSFKRAKTVHALDRAATVTGKCEAVGNNQENATSMQETNTKQAASKKENFFLKSVFQKQGGFISTLNTSGKNPIEPQILDLHKSG